MYLETISVGGDKLDVERTKPVVTFGLQLNTDTNIKDKNGHFVTQENKQTHDWTMRVFWTWEDEIEK